MTFILHGAGFSSLVLESDSKVALHLIEEASPFDPKIFREGNCQAALSLVSGWCEADGCPHNLARSGLWFWFCLTFQTPKALWHFLAPGLIGPGVFVSAIL